MGKNSRITTLATILLAGITFFAGKSYAENNTVQTSCKNDLFIGIEYSSDYVKSIFDLKNKNGAKVILELKSDPLSDSQKHEANIALRAPLVTDKLYFTASADYDNTGTLDNIFDNDYVFGSTIIMEYSPVTPFAVRGGYVNNNEKTADYPDGKRSAFAGFKSKLDYTTLEADIFVLNGKAQFHGYTAADIPINNKSLYLSVGTKTEKEQVNVIWGVINKGDFGVFSVLRV